MDTSQIAGIAFIWALCSAPVAYYAWTKGWNPATAFIGALIFSPVIAGIVIALQGDRRARPHSGAFKQCPFCAESIRADAHVCRYCQRDLQARTQGAVAHK